MGKRRDQEKKKAFFKLTKQLVDKDSELRFWYQRGQLYLNALSHSEVNISKWTNGKKALVKRFHAIVLFFRVEYIKLMTQSDIRKGIICQRNSLSTEFVRERSLKMTEDILRDKRYQEAKYIYVYSPINNEIDTNYLIVKALQDEKVVCLPIVLSKGDMIFSQINKTTTYRKDKHNILEPVLDPKTIVDKPGLMIVPVVGFNGNIRMGYGKQYYNNYLTNRRNYLYTIGVAYDFQKNEEIEFDERDVLLNEIRSY